MTRPDLLRFGITDDFQEGADPFAQRWTVTASDGGATAVYSAMNGLLAVSPSDGTVADNDEIYVASTQSLFLFKARRTLYGCCRLQCVEQNVNRANLIFGFMSSVGANALIDDGGGPRQSGSVCVFYKVDGGDEWRVQSRDTTGYRDAGTGRKAGVLTVTDTVDGVITSTEAFETLELWIDDPEPSRTVRDRVLVATFAHNGVRLTPQLEINVLDATEMQLMVGVKNGSSTLEALVVDVLHADQVRD